MGLSQLEKLEKQREALSKKIAEEKRKVDSRRRYLLGMVVEKAIADKRMNPQYIKGYAEAYVKNKTDRELLELPILEAVRNLGQDNQQ